MGEGVTQMETVGVLQITNAILLLMAEILHHLGCMKPLKIMGPSPYQLVSRISEPSTVVPPIPLFPLLLRNSSVSFPQWKLGGSWRVPLCFIFGFGNRDKLVEGKTEYHYITLWLKRIYTFTTLYSYMINQSKIIQVLKWLDETEENRGKNYQHKLRW